MVAGVVYGLMMGGYMAIQRLLDGGSPGQALANGLLWALPAALLFGLAMYWFASSRWFKRQSALGHGELIAGERVLHSQPANLIVRPKDFALGDFAFDDLFWLLGMRHKEAIGGTLHLSNLRLLFKSHRLNRVQGTLSVFLPTISQVEDTSFLLLRRFSVRTGVARLEFVASQAGQLVTRIEQAREELSADALRSIATHLQDPAGVVDGLAPSRAAERINSALKLGKASQDVVEIAGKPLLAVASLLAKELFERCVVERWQRCADGAGQAAGITSSDASEREPQRLA